MTLRLNSKDVCDAIALLLATRGLQFKRARVQFCADYSTGESRLIADVELTEVRLLPAGQTQVCFPVTRDLG